MRPNIEIISDLGGPRSGDRDQGTQERQPSPMGLVDFSHMVEG